MVRTLLSRLIGLYTGSAGLALAFGAALALVVANSPLAPGYRALLAVPFGIQLGTLSLTDSLLHWVNDGLMAVFFLHVGLELKRELRVGDLRSPRRALLPVLAALGGVAVPAAIYGALNRQGGFLQGWAIPSATDIAFTLGVLALAGACVPPALKVFVTALAVVDDLIAIAIVALFLSPDASLPFVAAAGLLYALLVALNAAGVARLSTFVVPGIVLWVLVLKSGLHATLAGVALAALIPLSSDAQRVEDGPLVRMERGLRPWVEFVILPVFAFANAGLDLSGFGWAVLGDPVTVGVALGLFVGKQSGIMAAVGLACRLGLARLPPGTGWREMYGAALLCGIGFTMSLFIAALSLPAAASAEAKLGILLGSGLAALAGLAVLKSARRRT